MKIIMKNLEAKIINEMEADELNVIAVRVSIELARDEQGRFMLNYFIYVYNIVRVTVYEVKCSFVLIDPPENKDQKEVSKLAIGKLHSRIDALITYLCDEMGYEGFSHDEKIE